MCSDDRFSPDSTTYKKHEPGPEWDEAMTILQYFEKAFRLGVETHPVVQVLAGVYPRAYAHAEREHVLRTSKP